jgi:hypothetical protein
MKNSRRIIRRFMAGMTAPLLASVGIQAVHAVDLPLLNGNFTSYTTASSNTTINKWVTVDYENDFTAGSVYSHTNTYRSAPRGVVMYPKPLGGGASAHVSLSQPLDPGLIVGETLTVTGYYRKSLNDSLALRVKICYGEGGGSDAGDCGAFSAKARATGFWNDTNCVTSNISTYHATEWQQFTVTCTDPIGGTTNLSLADVWLPVLVIETMGTAAPNSVIVIDDITVGNATDLTEPTHTPTAVAMELDPVPLDAAFSSIASRDDVEPGVPEDDGEGFDVRDLYASRLDGTEAARITNTTGDGGYLNTAINPVNHRYIAVERISEDWNHDLSHDFYDLPHQIWILDTQEDEAWQLTPTYRNAGLASVEWSMDGEYVFFGMTVGRHWWLYKAKPTAGVAFAPIRLTNTATTTSPDAAGVCNETDLGISNSGDWAVFRSAAENVDGLCAERSKIFKVRLANDQSNLSAQAPVLVWDPPGSDGHDPVNGIPPHGDFLPIGGYDAEFSATDDEFLLSWNNSETVDVNAGGLDVIRIDNCDVPGRPSCPIDPGEYELLIDDESFDDIDNYDWRIQTEWHWNPSYPDDKGFISATHVVDGEYAYLGLNSYDPTVNGITTVDEVEDDLYTDEDERKGTQYNKLITGGRHNANNTDPCPSPSSGFASASSAYKDDDVYASAESASTNNVGRCQSYSYYGFPIPNGATIDGIEVRVQWKADSVNWGPKLQVSLTTNAGLSWTTAEATSVLASNNTEQRDTLGGPTFLWGTSWDAAKVHNNNFAVLLTTDCGANDLQCALATRDWWIDWVGVRVYWHL